MHAMKKYTHIFDGIRKQSAFKELRGSGEGGDLDLLPYSQSLFTVEDRANDWQTKICDLID